MSELERLTTDGLLERAAEVALADETRESDEWGRVVTALHRRPEQKVFAAAKSWCANSNPALRKLGADALAQLGYAEPRPFAIQAEPVLERLLCDPDVSVIASAVYAYGHNQIAHRPVICELASHPSPEVREAVVFGLVGNEDQLSIQTLIQLSSDECDEVRDWATFGIGTQIDANTAEIREALAARLHDEHVDTRHEAIVGLARCRDERVVPAILQELDREDPYNLPIEAAELFPHVEFIAPLEKLDELFSDDDDHDIRLALKACRALDR